MSCIMAGFVTIKKLHCLPVLGPNFAILIGVEIRQTAHAHNRIVEPRGLGAVQLVLLKNVGVV